MKLFSFSKRKMEFRSIQKDDEGRIFDALEEGGWIMDGDPFTFSEPSRNLKKIRRFATEEAEERKAELLLESYDPYLAHMETMGLSYTTWRKATPEEIKKREELNRLKEERKKAEMTARGLMVSAPSITDKEVREAAKALEGVGAPVQKPSEVITAGTAEEEPDMIAVKEVEVLDAEINPYEISGKTYEETIKSMEKLEKEEGETPPEEEELKTISAPAPELVSVPSPPEGKKKEGEEDG